MATYYVRGTNGSDLNSGLSRALAFKTMAKLATVMVSNDNAYLSENFRPVAADAGAFVLGASNIAIQQDPNGDQFEWFGGIALTPGTWVSIGSGRYTYATGLTGLGSDGLHILYNYLTSTNSRGSHYGTLKRAASAAAVATTGTAGSYWYETTTGLVTAYFGGANPASATTHYVARKSVIAMDITGNNVIVSGLHFIGWQQEDQGACVWVKDAISYALIEDCISKDCGPHAFICSGQIALMAGNTISGCYSYGGDIDAAHYTFYQTNGFGDTSNLRFVNCHAERHGWLNIDQTSVPDTLAQNGFYAHADAGTPLKDMELQGCTGYDLVALNSAGAANVYCNAPIAAIGSAAPASEGVWSSFQGRATGCNFQNMCRYVNGDGYFAFKLCVLNFEQQGASGLCSYGGLGMIGGPASGRLLFEACDITANSTGNAGTSIVGVAAMTASCEVRFHSCSWLQKHTAVDGSQSTIAVYTTGELHFVGCVVSFDTDTTVQKTFSYSPGGGSITLDDNAWGLMPDGQGTGGSGTNANTIGANPFVSDSNLRISPASALYPDRRATTTIEPAALINGPYDGSFGAYGYRNAGSATATIGAGRGARSRRRSRLRG